MTDAEKAAWRAGAEAMRKAAARHLRGAALHHGSCSYDARAERDAHADHDHRLIAESAEIFERAIRALPLPEPPDA